VYKKESGQVLILTTLASIALLGFVSFVTDIGLVFYDKKILQTVADSAALGGAAEILYGNIATGATTAATLNNFISGTNGATLAVNHPPTSGPHLGDSNFVEAIAANVQPMYFAKILGINSTNVSARAVAVGLGPLAASKNCIYALGNPGNTSTNYITMNGSQTYTAGCGVIDNGGLAMNGSGAINASSIGLAGSYSNNGSGGASPTPVTGMMQVNDPLAYLTPPATTSSPVMANPSINGSNTTTLNPGYYSSGISINGSGTVNFNPGTYTIGGNGISINGSSTIHFGSGMYMFTSGDLTVGGSQTISGSDVTFYFGPSAGSVNGNGSPNFQLSAPTTGSYAGILFYQNPANSNAATFNGSSNSGLTGALYFPSASLNLNGSQSSSLYSILVAQSINSNGSQNVTMSGNYSSLPNGSPIHSTKLVE